MEDFAKMFSGWSWEENKLFELALAVVDEERPDRWEVVAAIVGGKSADEVEKHYGILLEDVRCIESGELDHRHGEAQLCLQVDECTQPDSCNDEEDQTRPRELSPGDLASVSC